MAASKEQLKQVPQKLADLAAPHVDSFNFFLDEGLGFAVADLEAAELEHPGGSRIRWWFEEVTIGTPSKNDDAADTRLFPNECRERALSYRAPMNAIVCCSVDDAPPEKFQRRMGLLPIMVKSSRCHLANLSGRQLIEKREEENEFGGYFIINGNERCVRLLQVPRRNHITALVRPSFGNRGGNFTEYATSIRCARADSSSVTVNVHYLSDGDCCVRFMIRKQEFFVPLVMILKALGEWTDKQLYLALTQHNFDNSFLCDRIETVLRTANKTGLHTQLQCLQYLGVRFRRLLDCPASWSDEEAARVLLRRYLFVHLSTAEEKFDLLLVMVQKLYALASGEIREDNADSLVNHEVLLPGHLYLMYVKEQLHDWLGALKQVMLRDMRMAPEKVDLLDPAYFKKVCDKAGVDIGRKCDYLMSTGNLISNTGLDLMQTTGYTIVAEKLNYWRYISHFRSIHRGSFFAELRTTTVRKLLPDSWGFLCPVHTPDGSPCGLLNHFTAACKVQIEADSRHEASLLQLLFGLGLTPAQPQQVLPHACLPLLLNGRVLGRAPLELLVTAAAALRRAKTTQHPPVPTSLEVVLVKPITNGQFPGLFLYTGPARMLRPVQNLETSATELIGTWEQIYMTIAITAQEYEEGVTTHCEEKAMNMLSVVASLTPFSDFNQSPRNMYQCQMGKQTMGVPCHSFPHRTDTKMYRLQNPQTPLVSNDRYKEYGLDSYTMGTNAVVAVLSYTGYDMEDAMILNKGSYERGFGHASVYTCLTVDLTKISGRGEQRYRFGNVNSALTSKDEAGKEQEVLFEPKLDRDGLPQVGMRVEKGDPLYVIIDDVTGKADIKSHKSLEPAVVDEVRLLGREGSSADLDKAIIKLRYNRNPIPGDKFSSRHGQKGVMSQLWPQENMPFSENGISPDVIINPHAFPSRMTIGMMVESMAGKSAGCHGVFQDGTPFRFDEQQRAVDYFGEQLQEAGYHYYGNERLYSGIYGVQFSAHIYMGLVYYQRLRHMVSDKYQVRAKGPVNNLTRQPIKGRKVQGGIRFGEMERDSLLGHGCSFLLNDRLMMCSDAAKVLLCTRCGSLLSTQTARPSPVDNGQGMPATCRKCQEKSACQAVHVPYVFLYLINELAAMNIKVDLKTQTGMNT